VEIYSARKSGNNVKMLFRKCGARHPTAVPLANQSTLPPKLPDDLWTGEQNRTN
jgi:hypothetical protein